MVTFPFPIRLAVSLSAIVLAPLTLTGHLAADDDALRREVLALNNLTGTDPINAKIEALAKDKDHAQKLLEVAGKMVKEKDQPFNYNALYILARTAQEFNDLAGSEVFYRLAVDHALKLQSGQKMAQSFGGLIDLYYEHKKYDETVKICREFLEIQGSDAVNRLKPAVMERMIQSLTRQKKFDQALKFADNLVQAEAQVDANGWLFLQLKGWVQREADQTDEAIKTYETVLERIGKDKNLGDEERAGYAERARYLLSGLYIDANQVDRAAEHLQALLKAHPDNPTYNNDLGYIWADHDMNLEEAEKLIRKALDEDRKLRQKAKVPPEEDKDNPAYLDSLGWVLFKQKKYAEAKKYLLEAVKDKEGQHIEILGHLGDVHLALKERDEAIKVYKKALEVAGDNKREQARKAEVEKKLKALEQ
jgi:tetratricopeptide (TPR) repeat protein